MTPLEHLRAAMSAADAYYKQQGIFQDRFGFGQRPALIVIDMAYGWTDPAYAGGSSRLDAAIAAINQLVPLAQARKVPLIFTTSPYPDRPRITCTSASAWRPRRVVEGRFRANEESRPSRSAPRTSAINEMPSATSVRFGATSSPFSKRSLRPPTSPCRR